MSTLPDFSLDVSRQVGKRLQRIEIRVEDLIFRSAESRIARVIAMLVDDFGSGERGQISVKLKLTQAEIATLAGCSRLTAGLAIAIFRKQGLLALRAGQIKVFDADTMRHCRDNDAFLKSRYH
ncbi:Crp/Fnr family transcriptional regulator [Ruegeria atlantica]|uniref:Crp/Fnr family transcriptional regulator n=1 Tax=Ruegeria atlantica TaxID=81569 RepID=UPI00147BD8DD|nr:Crp/Fnr family transcriptional regulator [Ruegeria atlantica]